MDLSQLSDEDLKRLAANDYTKLSDNAKTMFTTAPAAPVAQPDLAIPQQGPVAPTGMGDFAGQELNRLGENFGTAAGAVMTGAQMASANPVLAGAAGLGGLGAIASNTNAAKQFGQDYLQRRAAETAAKQAATAGTYENSIINAVSEWRKANPNQPLPADLQKGLNDSIARNTTRAEQMQAAAAARVNSATSAVNPSTASKLGMLGTAGKMAGRAMPFVGFGLGAADTYNRAQQGDYIGAGISGLATGASLIPGLGTAASLGLTGINTARDYSAYLDAKRKYEEQQKAMKR
jgi:hypothetical protein